VIAPWHGLFVVGRDIDAAFDLTERIDTNAYCILMGAPLAANGQADPLALQARLAQAIKSFNDNQPHA
jgi:ribulose-5-phosphate 4-epimerase/fuculose-1-phosphate aldolase